MSRYVIRRSIHKSAMAEVLEAVVVGERDFTRRVAIKRLLPESAVDDSFLRAFIDEAHIAGQLHHSRIVSVLDFGTMDDLPFLVLEYVDGPSLYELEKLATAAGTKISLEVALHVTAEIGHALAHAHGAKDDRGRALSIVHRDVNPSNVLLSWDDGPKLTDFGIALTTHRLDRTQLGVAKGTLSYMAPEQLTQRGVDARTDVFALGLVLHRLLAGHSPMEDDKARAAVATGANPTLAPNLPEAAARIIERATKTAKEKRYSNALELAEDCENALHALTTRAPRVVLREWISAVRPKEAAAPAHDGIAGLFDLELIQDAPVGGGIRRYQTVARPEPTRATQIVDTFVPAKEPQPSDEPTPILESKTPIIELKTPVLQTPASIVVQHGPPPRPLLIPGILLGVLVACAALMFFLTPPPSEPEPMAIEDAAPDVEENVVAVALSPPPRVETPEPEPTEVPDTPEPNVTPDPKRPKTTRTPPPSPSRARNFDAELAQRLEQRGLVPRDLDARELAQFRAAALANDAAAAEASLSRLAGQSVDAKLVQGRLKRVAGLLESSVKRLPPDQQKELDEQYFELRARFRPSLSGAELTSLAREVLRLEQKIDAATR